MSTIVIKYNNIDITDDVLISDASFVSQVNGVPGTCSFRVKDTTRAYQFVVGKSLTLDINGERKWGGYVSSVGRNYFFSVDRTVDAPRSISIQGVDYNVLLERRVIYDKGSPTKLDLTAYAPGTMDGPIIKAYLEGHSDLADDGITTTLVETIDTPTSDDEIRGHASWTFNEFMQYLAYHLGTIWYIDPEKNFVYTDVDTPNADYVISDQPSTVTGVFTDTFTRTVSPGWGNGWTVHTGSASNLSVDGSVGIINPGTFVWLYLPFMPPGGEGTYQYDFYIPADTSDTDFYFGISIDDGVTYGSWLDVFPNGDGDWWLSVDGEDYLLTAPTASTWYTAKMEFVPSLSRLRAKAWKRSDPEPGWQIDRTPPVVTQGEDIAYFWAPAAEDGQVDNFIITAYGVVTPQVGCRDLEITYGGDNLRNDVLIWGAGQGQDQVVFHRSEDATSQGSHGRWQLGKFDTGVWKDTTVTRIADSYVYGSPQNKRGGKDDAISVHCTVLQDGFQVGQKVEFISEVFNYTDVLPIRTMEIQFLGPTQPLYRLVLSHEIDDPFRTFDPVPISIEVPPIPDIGQLGNDPCQEIVCSDPFTRSVANGWGGSNVGQWEPYNPSFDVNGTMGVCIPTDITSTLADFQSMEAPFPQLPFEALIRFQVRSRFNPASYSAYHGRWEIFLNSTGSISDYLVRAIVTVDAKDGTLILSVGDSADTHTDSTMVYATNSTWNGYYGVTSHYLRLRVTPTSVRAKVWASTTPEPSSWQAQIAYGPREDWAFFNLGFNNYPGVPGGGPSEGFEFKIDNIDFVSGYGCGVLLDSDGTSACIDLFNRSVAGSWGTSPIQCLQWKASGNGNHSVAGGIADFSWSIDQLVHDWIELSTWDGSAVEFLAKIRAPVYGETDAGVRIFAAKQTGLGLSGPSTANDPEFAWAISTDASDDVLVSVIAVDSQAHTTNGSALAITNGGGEIVWVRGRLTGTTISYKAWLDGSSEPLGYQVTATQALAVFLHPTDGIGGCDIFGINATGSSTSGGASEMQHLEFLSGITCSGACSVQCWTGDQVSVLVKARLVHDSTLITSNPTGGMDGRVTTHTGFELTLSESTGPTPLITDEMFQVNAARYDPQRTEDGEVPPFVGEEAPDPNDVWVMSKFKLVGVGDSWFWVRGEFDNAEERWRAWLDGDAEPGTWDYTTATPPDKTRLQTLYIASDHGIGQSLDAYAADVEPTSPAWTVGPFTVEIGHVSIEGFRSAAIEDPFARTTVNGWGISEMNGFRWLVSTNNGYSSDPVSVWADGDAGVIECLVSSDISASLASVGGGARLPLPCDLTSYTDCIASTPISRPIGWTCQNLGRISTPAGQDPLNTYFQADGIFLNGSTQVWVDGLFVARSRYIDHGDERYIELDSSVEVGGGDVFDPPKAVYMCYTAIGSA